MKKFTQKLIALMLTALLAVAVIPVASAATDDEAKIDSSIIYEALLIDSNGKTIDSHNLKFYEAIGTMVPCLEYSTQFDVDAGNYTVAIQKVNNKGTYLYTEEITLDDFEGEDRGIIDASYSIIGKKYYVFVSGYDEVFINYELIVKSKDDPNKSYEFSFFENEEIYDSCNAKAVGIPKGEYTLTVYNECDADSYNPNGEMVAQLDWTNNDEVAFISVDYNMVTNEILVSDIDRTNVKIKLDVSDHEEMSTYYYFPKLVQDKENKYIYTTEETLTLPKTNCDFLVWIFDTIVTTKSVDFTKSSASDTVSVKFSYNILTNEATVEQIESSKPATPDATSATGTGISTKDTATNGNGTVKTGDSSMTAIMLITLVAGVGAVLFARKRTVM